ncbi:hypothetical protein BGZ96_008296 [Linnemannia gamsii]|uniref:Myb-like domain-containing protein n=1 Tax=Linnemannia gamsii TaxID=64522 RepID=A0ABQ7JZ20_9FUNG|nr:hypothetical protein BGZ96_008296 [Linnemannia gamsii]
MKLNRGAGIDAAETEDLQKNDTADGLPASPLITTGRKRQRRRCGSQQEEERMMSSSSPYRTRSQSRSQTSRHVDSRVAHYLPMLKGRPRYNAPPQPSRKTSFRGGQRIGGAKTPRRQMRNIHDSGFAMDDEAEDDKTLTQGDFCQGSDMLPREQKKARSDRRNEWLNAAVSAKLPKASSHKRRKVEAPSTRVHGYYQPQEESDLSSDSESSDEGNLSEDHDTLSSTTYSSSSDLSRTSSSSSDTEDNEQSEQSALPPKSFERSVSTSTSSTKFTPVRSAKSKAQTKITTKTTAFASATPILKKVIFGSPSRRLPAIKKPLPTKPPTIPLPPPPPPPTPQHHPQPIFRPTPTRPLFSITPAIQSRSRPPRQVRVKTGRWTKAEDAALYGGVVAYLAQYGLEPKPPAHLPLPEDSKLEKKQEKEEGDDHEHNVEGEGVQSTSERVVEERDALETKAEESRDRLDCETVIWGASAAAYQMSKRYRITSSHDFESESEAELRKRENDTYRLFEELVDVSRDNVQTDCGSGGSGQDGPLLLEPPAGQRTSVLSPLHKGSSFDREQIPGLNIHSVFDGLTFKPDMIYAKMDVHHDNGNQNHQQQQQQQQQGHQFQQQHCHQHLHHLSLAYTDQTYHIQQQQQQQQWPLFPQNHQQYTQNYQHQQQYVLPDQQYGFLGIPPLWNEPTLADQPGDDVWLAQISGESMRNPDIRTVASRDNGFAFKNGGGVEAGEMVLNNWSRRVASEEAAIEMVLFENLFPGTNTNTTTTSTSPSPSTHTVTFNTSMYPDQPYNTPPTTAHLETRYKTQNSYTSAISRQITTCPWSHIASLTVPGRTGVQAQARWSEALDPRVKKGPWSPEEDELLLEGVEKSDKCWIWIADMIDGRTQRQCRTRWVQLTIEAERRAALAVLEGIPQF